ncbi:hypothetical protein MIMGU_mgv1a017909mg, partial [Erythranthe guttata]
SLLTSRVERGALRRSQSLVSRKPAEPLSHRVENSRISGNGVVSRGSNLNVSQKAVFEKDFPSLRTEEKQCATGIRRVSSPGLSSAVQCLPIGNTGFLGGEKWTSALAEVPDILANNGISHSPLQQGVVPSSNSSLGISSSAGLNMAEALSQPVARVHPSSQLSDKSQRLEELAIKQSRQLIPMTSSMPKALVPSADKSKQPKIVTRANETTVASRGIHPQPHASHLANQPRAGQIRSDSANTSHVGKFLVLKPGRESVTHGDNANGEVTNDGQLATAPLAPTGSISLSNSVVSALENKTAALSLSSSSADLSPSADTSGENCNGKQMNCNGERCEIPEKNRSSSDAGEKSFSVNGSVYPDEEEAAFLRSLGWEENGGEDEGLTEEEINAFYQEVSAFSTNLFRARYIILFHLLILVTEIYFILVNKINCSLIFFAVYEQEAILESMSKLYYKLIQIWFKFDC